jgi:hypothetical protein
MQDTLVRRLVVIGTTVVAGAVLAGPGLSASDKPPRKAVAPTAVRTAKERHRDAHIHVLRAGGDLQRFVNRLGPGDIGKLAPGTYGAHDTVDLSSSWSRNHPIRLTSRDRSAPATIAARLVFQRGANHWTLDHLNLDAASGNTSSSSITIGSDNVTLRHNDITNQDGVICINTLDDPTWGVAHDTLIALNRIHDCGSYPVVSASSRGYFSHGIYASGYGAVIKDNWIYRNSGRGVQLRGSRGALVVHNVIDRNGAGVIIGDLDSSDNVVAYNIITNNSNEGRVNSFGIYSWWGGATPGSGNVARGNCLFGNQAGQVSTDAGGFRNENELLTNPRYVVASPAKYRLRRGSPCSGSAPAGTPGVAG